MSFTQSQKSTQELEESFEIFLKIVGEEPTTSFYKNWKKINSTLFTPLQLLNYKESEKEAKAILNVIKFMGYPVTGDLVKDITKIEEEKLEVHFDNDLFCKHLFNSFDLDSTEAINLKELANMMSEMSLYDEIVCTPLENEEKTKEKKAEMLFREMDFKKTGKIDLSEFQEWFNSRNNKI